MRYKKFLFSIFGSLGIVSILFLGSYIFSSDYFKKKNKLVVGVANNYEPFAFLDNDELVGFDVDLIYSLAQSMGKEVNFKTMSIGSLLDSLSNKKVDVVISGFRQDQVPSGDFDIVPYKAIFVSNYRCIVSLNKSPKSGEKNTKTKELPVAKISGKIGAITGTPEESYLLAKNEKSDDTDFKLFSVPSGSSLLEGLRTGEIDGALILNYQFLRLNEDADLDMQCIPIESIKDGASDIVYDAVMVVRKNSHLKHSLKEAMDDVVESGRYDILKMSWLTGGSNEEEEAS